MIKAQPDALETQVRDVSGLNKKEASIELFHYWMREHDSIKSGSIVDYRKYVAEFLDSDGELDAANDLGSHKSAAVNKYREFLQTDLELNSTTSTED